MPKPSVGCIVHYVNRDPRECRAAIITCVHPSEGAGTLADLRGPEEVDLAVFASDGASVELKCRHSEGSQTGGTWHWPEREES